MESVIFLSRFKIWQQSLYVLSRGNEEKKWCYGEAGDDGDEEDAFGNRALIISRCPLNEECFGALAVFGALVQFTISFGSPQLANIAEQKWERIFKSQCLM